MIAINVKRPRNVDWKRAAAILHGDWGTSKAYVTGLAFAVAGYASFWLIALMCLLTALVGINYMITWRLYPDGGGVYASVRHRSEVIFDSPLVLLCGRRICRRSHSRHRRHVGRVTADSRGPASERASQHFAGNLVREVSDLLPEEIDLLVYA